MQIIRLFRDTEADGGEAKTEEIIQEIPPTFQIDFSWQVERASPTPSSEYL